MQDHLDQLIWTNLINDQLIERDRDQWQRLTSLMPKLLSPLNATLTFSMYCKMFSHRAFQIGPYFFMSEKSMTVLVCNIFYVMGSFTRGPRNKFAQSFLKYRPDKNQTTSDIYRRFLSLTCFPKTINLLSLCT